MFNDDNKVFAWLKQWHVAVVIGLVLITCRGCYVSSSRAATIVSIQKDHAEQIDKLKAELKQEREERARAHVMTWHAVAYYRTTHDNWMAFEADKRSRLVEISSMTMISLVEDMGKGPEFLSGVATQMDKAIAEGEEELLREAIADASDVLLSLNQDADDALTWVGLATQPGSMIGFISDHKDTPLADLITQCREILAK